VYERFEADPDCMALAVVDADGRPVGIIERNAFFLRMASQYGRALFARRPVSMVMNAAPLVSDGGASVADFLGQVLAERPSELLQGFIVTDEGRYLGVGSVLSLLKASSDANHAHASEMTRVAETLNRARQDAQTALQARSRFLATMSHEIRTPLNGVLAIAELLARRMAEDELKPFVETIIRSGETLLRLLSDALDLSRADASALELVEDAMPLAPLAADLAALWEPRASQKGLRLLVDYQGPDDQWVLGDGVRIKQIFNNLIGNAIKFTDDGQVSVRLQAERSGVFVKLAGEVADTGVGVPQEALESIFAPFGQTQEGMARGGAGLGLSVCRELASRMHGRIDARRGDPGGTVFRFEATLYDVPPAAAAGGAEPDAGPALPRLNVLIADDNPTNRLVAGTLCEHLGMASQAVENGELALEAVRGGRFDLVLMDIKMPVMDGLAAARAIRNLPAPMCETPILALTANADPWDAALYLAEGMDGVVEKPIKIDRLAEAIAAALEMERRRAA
jgi:signal transduction histidine kinase/ActR/RegA family two-component response regulator